MCRHLVFQSSRFTMFRTMFRTLRPRLIVALLLALSVGPKFVHSQDCETHERKCKGGTTKTQMYNEISNCFCCAGFGRLNVRTWNDGVFGRFCTPCPAGQFSIYHGTYGLAKIYESKVGAALEFDPVNVWNGNLCDLCPAGKFQANRGMLYCNDCPAGSTSTTGSSTCQCIAGYTGSACTACVTGKYKSGTGSGSCSDCQANSYTPVASISAEACQCNAGYTGSACTGCVAGKYKNSTGSGACWDCQANSYAPVASISAEACLCNAGYTGSACTACVTGKYKSGTGSGACSDCQANSHAPVASISAEACQCNAGYTGSACTACVTGKYKSGTGSGACSDCPANSYAPVASMSAEACQCNAGYTGSACTACPAGKYKSGTGNGICLDCDANSGSIAGSSACTPLLLFASSGRVDQPHSCAVRCTDGYFRVSSSQNCTLHSSPTCPPGEFRSAGTHNRDAACQPCSGCAGRRKLTSCNTTADDACADCGPLPNIRTQKWVSQDAVECVLTCLHGLQLNKRTEECELCSGRCAPGLLAPRQRDNCTHCEACPVKPANSDWLTQDDRFDCAWECKDKHALLGEACVRWDNVFEDVPTYTKLQATCPRGHTLVDFKCTPCFEAVMLGAVGQADLPQAAEEDKTWTWTTGCRWECRHVIDYEKTPPAVYIYSPLRTETGNSWMCVQENHRSLLLSGPDDSWIATGQVHAGGGAASRRSAVPSALQTSEPLDATPARSLLVSALLALVAVPVLALKCSLLGHCLWRCKRAS